MMNYDEKTILKELSDPIGQRAAFAKVVQQYSEQLYWKIRHIVINHEDANDVLQNVFIKAWMNLEDFQGKAKLSTWLYRIAINESLDFLRKQKTQNALSADEDLSLANRLLADNYFDGDEAQALLQEAIAQLPDVQRTVFTLRYFDEMKYSEISRHLGTSEGALKASYHLAVKKITEYFRQRD
ncbi:MAG: RNA polymerase sigma factor [Prevotella sp.]|nr:RNA polymerase sigma factor [Prevotella sp.]